MGLDPEKATLDPDENFDIFVSYRVNPDEQLAVAVRQLLESSIEDQPRVFVSGAGGIKASAMGFREQIQRALQSSKVVVGIITPSSIDREWIFFEAGAAFGRGIMYVPLALGVDLGALPSSLSGYQAVSLEDKPRVQDLVRHIATSIRREPASRFGSRYSAVMKSIRKHQQLEEFSDSSADAKKPIERALDLFRANERTEALKLLDETESSEASSVGEKTAAAIARYIFGRPEGSEDDVTGFLYTLPVEYRRTGMWLFWHARHEQRQLHREAALLLALQSDDVTDAQKAMLLSEAINHDSSNVRNQAISIATKLWDSPNADTRQNAADATARLPISIPEPLRVIIACFGSHHGNHAATRALSRGTVFDTPPSPKNPLRIYASRREIELTHDHGAHNNRGIVLSNAGFPSLAFDAYSVAASRGVTVAAANMAGLHLAGAVASAALALTKPIGEWDSSDPSYPHKIRTDAEKEVRKESEAVSAIETRGQVFVRAASKAVELILLSNGDAWADTQGGNYSNCDAAWLLPDESLLVSIDDNVLTINTADKSHKANLETSGLFQNVQYTEANGSLYLVVLRDNICVGLIRIKDYKSDSPALDIGSKPKNTTAATE